jgi:hypothetical protein
MLQAFSVEPVDVASGTISSKGGPEDGSAPRGPQQRVSPEQTDGLELMLDIFFDTDLAAQFRERLWRGASIGTIP